MVHLNGMQDLDPLETKEWLAALRSVIKAGGPERAAFLLKALSAQARDLGAEALGFSLTTPYKNTISPAEEPEFPGDLLLEERILALIRWNAVAIVVRAGKVDADLGGHIGSFASSASLYDVGFNHFWRGLSDEHDGDLVYFQGHTSPGMYARSYLEGKLSEDQLVHFRREIKQPGLSSYPHPWLMPDYWQFPTVSMGLGPLQAIYQARFMRYLQARNLAQTDDRHVWCFCGDGEMDEPESLGAITVAAREHLDNLIFVVNCNLQRLDGPVRGNGKIIQELEAVFNGAGWNVIKVIWGSSWDPLFEQDIDGLLQARMEEAVDGEYQNFKAHGGAYTREHFFGKYPELKERVENLSDEQIAYLKRGGHDPLKIYAAYKRAVEHKDQPTVILIKTVKGYGLGTAGEALNTSHNTKKMAIEQLKIFRDRFEIPIKDEDLEHVPFYRPSEDSPEMRYLMARRQDLGGKLPGRRRESRNSLTLPPLSIFQGQLAATGDREISTTMSFVRILSALCKDKAIGPYIVPIVPDEARTFGMEGLFRQLGIYAARGQLYEPVDVGQVMFYKESPNGQILEEGINEAGAFCSWLSAATSYSNHDRPMIPFYIYYSMFGFQRIGDLAWAAGDSRARGFLIGGTSGRTTLNGEGLQHEDGHSHVLASTIPNCISYDPTFSYELAVIIHSGMQRMYERHESVFYYISTMNENYSHPGLTKGQEEGIIKGIYPLAGQTDASQVQLLGSGTILMEVLKAQEILAQQFDIKSQVWSVTSCNELARDGQAIERWNRLHPDAAPHEAYVTQQLKNSQGPIIAATDYIKAYPEQLRQFMPRAYTVLGTDGFGRSDTRANLRDFFEVSRHHIVIAALKALVDEGQFDLARLQATMKEFGIDADKPNPMGC